MASSCCIILLSLFVPFLPIYAQISSSGELAHVQNESTIAWKLDTKISEMEVQMHAMPLQRPETAKTTEVASHKGHHTLNRHHKRHFRNAYGILILIGWGTLLPMGVIIARYCRAFPFKWNEWYSCHIVCQTLGYILGTLGWCIGVWLGNSSKQFVSKTQHTLSIVAFTFVNVQMLSIFMRPNKEAGYCKCWNICHHVLGYAIIGIVIANIFLGLHNQSQAENLKWAFVGILGVLGLVVVPLEIFRCKSTIMQQFVRLTGAMYANAP